MNVTGMNVTGAAPEEVLQSVFGYDSFRSRQEEVIQRLLSGGHALVVMPTGSGKSLCYQLPALVREGVGVVVSPLISLMQDQVAALRQQGARAAFLNSSLSGRAKRRTRQEVREGALDLLYVAPERLITERFQGLLSESAVALFAIDEAHCLSQWGHDFRPDYLDVARLRERFPQVPTIATTATADAETRRDLLGRLRMSREDLFVADFDRPEIRYTVTLKRNPKGQLKRFIEAEHAGGDAGIVYCLSRKKVEKTAAWLSEKGHEALPYHAGLSSKKRQRHQDRFLREEGLIIVATVAFGMGIDKPEVRFVAHLDLPKSLEAYYQETGRAGRDGQPANAWMAYRYADVVRLRKIIEGSASAGTEYAWTKRHKLNAMLGYCETSACRRRVLLSYFGQEPEFERCGNCDTCLDPVETWDATTAAQKLMSCIVRTGQRFGAGHVTDVLIGRDTKKIRQKGHQTLSTYDIGDELDKGGWKSVARQLVAADLLAVDVAGYGALKLTEASGPVLRGEREVELRKDRLPAPSSSKAQTRTAPDDELPDTPGAEELFEALRQKRTQLASEQGVPPYVVFADKTLKAMVAHRPATLDAFNALSGVGDVKRERYGEAFLAVIAEHAAEDEGT